MGKNSYNFTIWAERIAVYFGEYIAVYDAQGNKLQGDKSFPQSRAVQEMKGDYNILTFYGTWDAVGYVNMSKLTPSETQLLVTIKHFIESNIEKEMGAI